MRTDPTAIERRMAVATTSAVAIGMLGGRTSLRRLRRPAVRGLSGGGSAMTDRSARPGRPPGQASGIVDGERSSVHTAPLDPSYRSGELKSNAVALSAAAPWADLLSVQLLGRHGGLVFRAIGIVGLEDRD